MSAVLCYLVPVVVVVSILLHTVKRKRDDDRELMEYLDRADQRFLEHSERVAERMTAAIITSMEASSSALMGVMGEMVATLRELQHK